MSKGTIEPKKVRRGTGMWPLMLPRPWLLEPTPDEPVLIDPVAIASAAAHALEAVGWPGINLMEHEFLLSLVRLDDEKAGSAESVVSDWYQCHRSDVAGELRSRLATYRIDLIGPTARNAMAESLSNYEVGNYLSVVRTLMPEFEAFARNVYEGEKARPKQSDVIEWLKRVIDELPVTGDDAIDSFSLYHFIDDKLFAHCFTAADAQAFGDVANRHAEMHGLASYGHLKGATTLVCVTSYLLQLMDRYRALRAVGIR